MSKTEFVETLLIAALLSAAPACAAKVHSGCNEGSQDRRPAQGWRFALWANRRSDPVRIGEVTIETRHAGPR
jgi:hypothetical protein